MDCEKRSVVAEECDRLQAELRLTSQKNLIPELQDELRTLRFLVWSNDSFPPLKMILSPFQKMIEQPKSTDVITYVAVKALSEFLNVGLFTCDADVSALVQCLCSCQYQITSEGDCLALTIQMRCMFLKLFEPPYVDMWNIASIDALFKYCEQDIRQLSFNGTHSVLLTNVVTRILRLIVDREHLNSLAPLCLRTLFDIADSASVDCGCISRGVALSGLCEVSKSVNAAKYRDLIGYSCVLLHQQLKLLDGRDNFVLALRFFFNVFRTRWMELPMLFAKCFDSILEFCTSQTTMAAALKLRATAFEILIDFVSQPNMVLNLFANFSNHPFLGNLFGKFLSTVISFANTPSGIPDVQITSTYLIASIIDQLTSDCDNNQRICASPDDSPRFQREEEELELMKAFVTKFNQKPRVLDDMTAKDIAKMLFTADGISKQSIGDFFGNTKEICLEAGREFIDLFDFAPLDIDQSIRVFLTSFRIPGEAQIVDRLLNSFSQAFFSSHPNAQFASADDVHVLSTGYLMLHTSLHNGNVKEKETLAGFLKLLKGRNNGQDWDNQFLTAIYNSVKRTEISPSDTFDTHSLTAWEILMQRQRVLNLEIIDVKPPDQGRFVAKLVRETWQQAAPIFTKLFEHSRNETSLVLDTFSKCAAIASYYQMHDVLDNLVVSLCGFVNVKSSGSLAMPSSQEALRTLSQVVGDHGGQIQEAWKWFVDLLINLFKMDVLPEDMRTQTSRNVTTIIGPTTNNRTRKNTPTMLSWFKIIGAYESESESEGGSPALERNIEQRNLINECKLNQIFDQSLHFTPQSLSYFVKSLILTAQGFIRNQEERGSEAAVCLHWVTQAAMVNAERIQPLWNDIYDLLCEALRQEQTTVPFKQRVLASVFDLMNHLWGRQKMRGDLIGFLDKMTAIEPRMFHALLPDMLAGVKEFFGMHLATFVECFKFKAVLTMLSAGIGDESEPCVLLHELTSKFLAVPEQPGIERFDDLWLPLIQTVVMYSIRDDSPTFPRRFQDLQKLLTFPSFSEQTPEMWNKLFETTLFPAMAQLPGEITAQRKQHPNIIERSVLMVKTVFYAILQACDYLSELSRFRCIWSKLLQYSFKLMDMKNPEMSEMIPQLLTNAMNVLKESGVFDSQDGQQIWAESRSLIDSFS